MASQHIEVVATASRLSALVRRTVDAGRGFQEDIVKITDIFEAVAYGGDWESLRVKLGLDTQAQAETVYNLFVALNAALDANVFNHVLDRLG